MRYRSASKVPGMKRPSSKSAPEELVAIAMVEADVRVAAPQVKQKRLFSGISAEHPEHFGISHQYAQNPVTGYSFPDS